MKKKGQKPLRGLLAITNTRPLKTTVDRGHRIRINARDIGASGEHWIEPFLEANRVLLKRLDVTTEVDSRHGEYYVNLIPGSRVGAVPVLSPSTRRVCFGLLIEPRFHWSGLGAVLGDIGFSVEASIGGTPLVPGSAREVPAWLLAAPVIRRIEGFMRHRRRGFIEVEEIRQSPRGRIDWPQWARTDVPTGQWASLPCRYTEPSDDPVLMAAVRWTLGRLDDQLSFYGETLTAQLLRNRISDLRSQVGSGTTKRPSNDFRVGDNSWVKEATQAMGWVADERGLGGSRVLDGLSWDLPIDEVWEAWVDAFIADLAPRCGLTSIRRGNTSRRLNWSTSTSSMRMLKPDSGMRGTNHAVWIDAKYKFHLDHISSRGWYGLKEETQNAHRADLHQALAYASLEEAETVDSILTYPVSANSVLPQPGIATIASGRRRVRLLLLGLPFGFRSREHRESTLSHWRELLLAMN
ncbi:MAG: hypothetical protein NTX15_02315 [Candidatus Kapabacteria bacterium]|nr:hypothetical protein [Candidatus Kapabacteria bacterium]